MRKVDIQKINELTENIEQELKTQSQLRLEYIMLLMKNPKNTLNTKVGIISVNEKQILELQYQNLILVQRNSKRMQQNPELLKAPAVVENITDSINCLTNAILVQQSNEGIFYLATLFRMYPEYATIMAQQKDPAYQSYKTGAEILEALYQESTRNLQIIRQEHEKIKTKMDMKGEKNE